MGDQPPQGYPYRQGAENCQENLPGGMEAEPTDGSTMAAARGMRMAMSMRMTTSLRTVTPRTVSVRIPLAFSSVMTAMVVAGDLATATRPKRRATAKATLAGSSLEEIDGPPGQKDRRCHQSEHEQDLERA